MREKQKKKSEIASPGMKPVLLAAAAAATTSWRLLFPIQDSMTLGWLLSLQAQTRTDSEKLYYVRL